VKRLVFLLILAALVVTGCGMHQKPAVVASVPSYTFDDEFNGPAGSAPGPDWAYQTGYGKWGDDQTQTYTDTSYLDGQGHLIIKAVRTPSGWESSQLKSSFSQYQGTFSARIKFNREPGMWAAFWLLGPHWPYGGEIDVAEFFDRPGWGPGAVTVHGVGTQISKPGENPGTGWHVWTVKWNAEGMTFYRDGVVFDRVPASAYSGPQWTYGSGTKMSIMLNLAVGGDGGGPVGGTQSGEMEVDWVRASE
jgi:beta-glucanase (GH16 family)